MFTIKFTLFNAIRILYFVILFTHYSHIEYRGRVSLRKDLLLFDKEGSILDPVLPFLGDVNSLSSHFSSVKCICCFAGLFTPSQGKIIVNGKNIFDNMSNFRKSLGLCRQQNLVFPFFSVLDHLKYFGMVSTSTLFFPR